MVCCWAAPWMLRKKSIEAEIFAMVTLRKPILPFLIYSTVSQMNPDCFADNDTSHFSACGKKCCEQCVSDYYAAGIVHHKLCGVFHRGHWIWIKEGFLPCFSNAGHRFEDRRRQIVARFSKIVLNVQNIIRLPRTASIIFMSKVRCSAFFLFLFCLYPALYWCFCNGCY